MYNGKKILVVDDDDNMREAVVEILRRLGIEVDFCTDGLEGLKQAKKKPYDLIISDMRMPNLDGRSMFRELKAAGIETPLCFMTAFGTINNAVDCIKDGAYDYILKPFSLEVIEELVHRTFEFTSNKAQNGTDEESMSRKGVIFQSENMQSLFQLADEFAKSEATVLVTGESGTGKEVLSRYIHTASDRANGPFVAINCAALPENLIESELFGYEKGAFTGAMNAKPGKFEMADGGTILLDEIGEIPLHLQAKLLRVLQEKEVERIGANKVKKVSVRIIATTNRNLREMSEKGEFREDLFYRLNVISVELPPLRERKEDINALSSFFIEKYSKINKRPVKGIDESALDALYNYDFPGNIRELEHTIERAVVICKGELITPKDLFLHGITYTAIKRERTASANATNSLGNGGGHSSHSSASQPTTNNGSSHTSSNISSNNLHSSHNNSSNAIDPLDEPGNNANYTQESSQGRLDVNEIIKSGKSLADVERELILQTSRENGGNKTKTAEILGITVRTIRNKLNEYRQDGIDVEEFTG